jgi:hypothetical protein
LPLQKLPATFGVQELDFVVSHVLREKLLELVKRIFCRDSIFNSHIEAL